jgi:hypothetical protein
MMLLSELLRSRVTREDGLPLGQVVGVTASGRPRDGESVPAIVDSLVCRPPGWRFRPGARKKISSTTVVRWGPQDITIGKG